MNELVTAVFSFVSGGLVGFGLAIYKFKRKVDRFADDPAGMMAERMEELDEVLDEMDEGDV